MRVLVIVALVGCNFQHGGGPSSDGGVAGDARDAMVGIDAPDAFVAPPDARECFGSGTFELCIHPIPTSALVLPASINTDTSSACLATQPAGWAGHGQPDSCIIAADSIAVNAIVSVTGSRPLVLFATSTITISAALDVASYAGLKTGPGWVGSAARCGAFGSTPAADTSGGGGGAGGSYWTFGGDGGRGNGNNMTNGTTNNTVTAPTLLRAGCDGQRGGDGQAANSGGEPGHAGGAVYLVAGSTITLTATAIIDASGGGAPAGGKASGAGGAGSGGTIILWAPTIDTMTTAVLIANGGGGASGGDNAMMGHNGKAGSDPLPGAPATPALGGTGPGGPGGTGFAGTNQAGTGTNGGVNQGGGGGGGGAGYIRTNTSLGAAVVTPAADLVP